MEKQTSKMSKIVKTLGAKAGWFIIIALVFVLGYWLRGVISGPESGIAEAVSQADEAKNQRWTCSMHPQVNLPEFGLCPICNMDLIPMETDESTEMTNMRQLVVSENARALMNIETAPVERKFVSSIIRMVGKVDYDETRLAYITAWIPGRLDRLFVDYTGVPVQKGDHLVSLYSPELLSAQEELIQALKTVENVKASELSIMRESAQATVTAAREKLRLWGLTPEQIANIEKTGEVSDHMTIYAPAGGIVIHKDALEGMYVQEGTRIYTIADLSQVWAQLDAYESDLEWLRYGQKVEFTTVAYPGEIFTGTIAFIDPILTERTRTVKIRVNIPNADGKLKPEMFVKAVVRPQIAARGRIMDAKLAGKWMCPMHPDIVKDSPGKCDICEMPLVRTEALGYVSDDPTRAEKPLVIPVTAALVTGTRAIVYVQIPNTEKPTFEGREIVLGPRAGDYYLVRSGLQEGELVVVKGNFKIDSALQIMARPSMMTPAGGGGGGGHDHGGAPPATQDESGQTTMALSAMTRYQLQEVLMAAEEVKKTIGAENLPLIQATFSGVDQAIKAVDMELLTGQPHMVWMELSMRLTNDALEGSSAVNLPEAQRVAELLENDIGSLRNQMGIHIDHAAMSRVVLSEVFRDQLAEVYHAYFTLQQALADDNPETAIQAVNQMPAKLKNVDMKLVSGDEHIMWMQISANLEKVITETASTKDIKLLRENFFLLSQSLIKLANYFGAPASGPFYTMHCPMAFDNSGADWLQNNDQLRNPYFGAMMLLCGEITEVVPVSRIR